MGTALGRLQISGTEAGEISGVGAGDATPAPFDPVDI